MAWHGMAWHGMAQPGAKIQRARALTRLYQSGACHYSACTGKQGAPNMERSFVQPAEKVGRTRASDRTTVLFNIQTVRALAALMVVLWHLGELTHALGWEDRTLSFAALGVDLFFVVSGFIMVFTTQRRPTTGLDFLRNRIARVVPLYWMITLMVFTIAVFSPKLLQNTDAELLDLIRSLLFIPYGRADGTMRPMLFLGWSLNYEMFFYLLFAAALAIGGSRHHVRIAVMAIVALVAWGVLRHVDQTTVLGFYCNIRMLEFVAGMLIAGLWPYLPARTGLASVGLLIGSAWLIASPTLFVDEVATLHATAACSLILISALSAERAGFVVRTPLLVLLGNASYSLYLIHPMITQPIIKLWHMAGSDPMLAMIALPLAIIAASAAAIMLYRWVEMPLSRVARRLLSVRHAGTASGPQKT
jgi:exopolysaccharide production protein ExoZ